MTRGQCRERESSHSDIGSDIGSGDASGDSSRDSSSIGTEDGADDDGEKVVGDITRSRESVTGETEDMSSESVTGETEDTSNDDGEKLFGDDAPRSSESVTGEMGDGAEDDGDRISVGDITTESVTGDTVDGADEERDRVSVGDVTGETEDSCFVTGDASGDLKIPETSSCAAVISTQSESTSLSLSSCARSTTAYGDTVLVWQVSLKTGVSSSRSMRSSSAIALLLLKLKFVDIITRFLFSKRQK